MKNILKSVVIAVFRTLWLFGIGGAFNRWLIVAREQSKPDSQLAAQAARLLDDARTDLIIGVIWLGLVILFWAYRLSRFLDRHADGPPKT